ncbi:hypothetical protein ADK57_25880 [Streptomyces sp. MMG1533]|uniref:hypothetical protein n=1 Tax=Streptomyces sp. MMG1533 TaxID=1415546 RepID=UPI0006AE5F6B|nr:hypothetical protein [Streptomyces sp. MMG1533]KOU62065.1 hypothetical protein ADK57_25880 [Streptomyces sp. MMG1533]
MTANQIDASELAKALLRLADITQGMVERYGIYRDGRARISERAVLYGMFDLDPATYFLPENREGLAMWQAEWRQTRRDGTRGHYNALRDAIRDALVDQLPGDWRNGGLYTPDQIRDIAHAEVTAEDPS